MVKKKNIWLVNYYAMPPEFESRLRTIKFAHYLKRMGYEVTIISSSFLHNMDRNLISDGSKYIYKEYDDLNFIHIKSLSYKDNGLKRLYSLFEFHFKLFFLKRKFQTPDIIVHTVLPPFGNIVYYVAKKLKSKYIIEVLDLWPESFVDVGILKKNNPVLYFMYQAEKWVYKKADAIVFSMEGGKNYIIDKKWDKEHHDGPINLDKIHYINNGVDLDDFHSFKNKYKINDTDLNDVSIRKIIYIGSIRLANNLRVLIDAAEQLKNISDVKFLLYGNGDDREHLKKYCKEKRIDNVIFKETWIEPKYVPYVISQSTVNILNYTKGFGKYGGSQSKLFQYMASGIPICSNLKMMYCPISKYNIGIADDFPSKKEYAQAIVNLINLDDEKLMDMRTRELEAVKEFDYKFLTKKLETLF